MQPPADDEGDGRRPGRRRSFLRALRRHPTRSQELVLLFLLPQLAGHAAAWHGRHLRSNRPDPSPTGAGTRLARRSARRSMRDGAVIGSSFSLGMPAAVAALYCRQLVMVLQVAALFGHDPTHPDRAADLLVLQGRHPDPVTARASLQAAMSPELERPDLPHGVCQLVAQGAPVVGLRLRRFRQQSLWSRVVVVAEVVGYLIPVIGIPAWAVGSARATRQLGLDAVAYYAQLTPPTAPDRVAAYPPSPTVGDRRIFIGTLTGVTLLLVAALTEVFRHDLRSGRWILPTLLALFLLLTGARLLWITRTVTR